MKQLRLHDVSVRFGHVQALSRASLELGAGEAVILAGPNGAGKSTLISVLLGLVRPDSGALELDGRVQTGSRSALKEKLGYLPEAVAFAESLSGRQVLRFFARARGVPRARIDEVLQRVGLSAAARRAVRGYSRGMRQRLGLAVAILATPELLILDEPTGGLDLEGLSVLWSILEEWRAAGRMVLIATHDLAVMERRVDRVVLLKSGKVIAAASPSALRALVSLPVRVTLALGDDAEAAERLSEALARAGLAGRTLPGEGSLQLEVVPSALLQALEVARAVPNAVTGLRVEEPTLEEVYERLLTEPTRSEAAE